MTVCEEANRHISSVGSREVVKQPNKQELRWWCCCCPCAEWSCPCCLRWFCWDLCSFNCLQPKSLKASLSIVLIYSGWVISRLAVCSLTLSGTSSWLWKCSSVGRHSKLSVMLNHCQRLRCLPHFPSDLQVDPPPARWLTPANPDNHTHSPFSTRTCLLIVVIALLLHV